MVGIKCNDVYHPCRFLQLPELVERLETLHHSYRLLLKTAERLRKRIEDDITKCSVVLDEESETYTQWFKTIGDDDIFEPLKNIYIIPSL